jgi:gluconate 2-dehydrogenase alpha chain
MARTLKPVDVVTIGVGFTGSLAALELAKEGLKVVGLEAGAPRFTVPPRSTTSWVSRSARR